MASGSERSSAREVDVALMYAGELVGWKRRTHTSFGEFNAALRNFLALTVRTLGVAGSKDGNERPKPVIWERELRKEGGRAAAGVDS